MTNLISRKDQIKSEIFTDIESSLLSAAPIRVPPSSSARPSPKPHPSQSPVPLSPLSSRQRQLSASPSGLYLRSQAQHALKASKRHSVLLKRTENELKDVTFRPTINDNSRKITQGLGRFFDRVAVVLENERRKTIHKRSQVEAKNARKSSRNMKSALRRSAVSSVSVRPWDGGVYKKNMEWLKAKEKGREQKRETKEFSDLNELSQGPKVNNPISKRLILKRVSPLLTKGKKVKFKFYSSLRKTLY